MTVARPLFVCLFSGSSETLAEYGKALGLAATDEILIVLARALATNPCWTEMPHATIIVRTAPQPAIGILGKFDAAGEWRISNLADYLAHILPRLLFVDYAKAELACAHAAAQLKQRVGLAELENYQFYGVPRGGLIVLGMLAYYLGLGEHQLASAESMNDQMPLVVVDDCALTGGRFRRILERCKGRDVIFVTLYSHSDLRHAIESAEPRVTCISAHDLHDHGLDYPESEYRAWRDLWIASSEYIADYYWMGLTDHVCFPWNEPDTSIWNPITQKEEDGWYVLPPETCLKNRTRTTNTSIPMQVQAVGKGCITPHANVLFGELDDEVVIGHLDTGQCLALPGVAADMWRALVQYGDLEAVLRALSLQYAVEDAELRSDLEAFIQDMVAHNLLTIDLEVSING